LRNTIHAIYYREDELHYQKRVTINKINKYNNNNNNKKGKALPVTGHEGA
jgi:hypothetical protein